MIFCFKCKMVISIREHDNKILYNCSKCDTNLEADNRKPVYQQNFYLEQKSILDAAENQKYKYASFDPSIQRTYVIQMNDTVEMEDVDSDIENSEQTTANVFQRAKKCPKCGNTDIIVNRKKNQNSGSSFQIIFHCSDSNCATTWKSK